MKGLVDSIRSALRLLRPGDSKTTMELGRDMEDNLALQSGGRASNVQTRNNIYMRPSFNDGSGLGPNNQSCPAGGGFRMKQATPGVSG